MEISIEIGVWWVWWWWHGGRFLGLVLAVGFLLWVSWYGVEAGVWWWWHGGEAGVCCDWCLDWGYDLIFSVRDERDIFCAWVMGLQL